MAMPVIELSGLWTTYGETVIHQELELSIMAGAAVALVGGSGSGKTTLLRQILGLLQPSRGEVRLFGQCLADGDREAQRRVFQRLGMLFQQGALFSALSVFDNVAFPLRELGLRDEVTIRRLVLLKLDMVGISPAQAALMPAELSGGMVKRVALARALALEPELLLLDEPTAGLDPDRSQSFVRLIRELQAEQGFTLVMVTHDLETLMGLAQQVAVLAEKKIIAHGPLQQVMAMDHPFIHHFFVGAYARGVFARVWENRNA